MNKAIVSLNDGEIQYIIGDPKKHQKAQTMHEYLKLNKHYKRKNDLKKMISKSIEIILYPIMRLQLTGCSQTEINK